jgi:hypothetical protein
LSDFREYVGRNVMVQVEGDISIAGRFDREGKSSVVLVEATLHQASGQAPMDGEVMITVARMLWMQAI